MQKSIVGLPARDKALRGINYLADMVKSTIGPYGANALIEKGSRITNDGYTISKELCPAIKDEFERRGAIALHQASAKTNDQVGDATSTSVALAQAIIKEAIRYLPKEGVIGKMKATDVIEKINKEKDEVIELLKSKVKNIETEQELINSARVSVENEELADLIGKAQWQLGQDGMIIAEETAETKCSIENIKGVRLDNGLGTSYIINNQEKQTLEAEDLQVIMTTYTFGHDLAPIIKILDELVKKGKRNILLIARGYSPECIKACVQNIRNGINIFPISAPYVNQKQVMLDLQAVLGGRFIDTEEDDLENMTLQDVGFAKKIIARRESAIIAGDTNAMVDADVALRVEKLEKELKGAVSDFEKKSLQQRISQLKNGFALLKVGAETEIERKRRKDKADDAVGSVKLALQGGVVAGGGLAFKEIADSLPQEYILKKPLTCIYEQIMSSAPEGFVIEDWVKDPYLVLVSALNNACSVAGTIATVGCIICAENIKQGCCNNNQEEETNE